MRGKGVVAIAALVATTALTRAALADGEARVAIAGPPKDALAARLEREVVALGFRPVSVGALGDCEEDDVAAAALEVNASAVLCVKGTRVAVWTEEPGGEDGFVFRDLLAPESGAARDDVATRAAEVMRANVELREAEPAPKPFASPPLATTGSWEGYDQPDRPPAPPPPGAMTHAFIASFGPGVLMGTDGSSATLSGKLAAGIHRRFSLTARVDVPVSTSDVDLGNTAARAPFRVQTGLAGAGIEVPFFEPTARVIPRAGFEVGAAWMRATELESKTVPAAAGWVEASLSVGIYGPLRIVGEGLFGSTVGRLTAVDESGTTHTHFGTPMGALALRVEVALR